VIDQAILKKVLPEDEDLDTEVSVILPEFSARDEAQVAQTFAHLTNALTVARSQNWISDETAARLVALLAGRLGVEVDPEEERDRAMAAPADTEALKVALERIMPGGAAAGTDGSPESVPGQAQRA
jgi:hypothetical protein